MQVAATGVRVGSVKLSTSVSAVGDTDERAQSRHWKDSVADLQAAVEQAPPTGSTAGCHSVNWDHDPAEDAAMHMAAADALPVPPDLEESDLKALEALHSELASGAEGLDHDHDEPGTDARLVGDRGAWKQEEAKHEAWKAVGAREGAKPPDLRGPGIPTYDDIPDDGNLNI